MGCRGGRAGHRWGGGGRGAGPAREGGGEGVGQPAPSGAHGDSPPRRVRVQRKTDASTGHAAALCRALVLIAFNSFPDYTNVDSWEGNLQCWGKLLCCGSLLDSTLEDTRSVAREEGCWFCIGECGGDTGPAFADGTRRGGRAPRLIGRGAGSGRDGAAAPAAPRRLDGRQRRVERLAPHTQGFCFPPLILHF